MNTSRPPRLNSQSGRPSTPGIGIGMCQPPKNRIDSIAHISTIETYSPIMNLRYGEDEYST